MQTNNIVRKNDYSYKSNDPRSIYLCTFTYNYFVSSLLCDFEGIKVSLIVFFFKKKKKLDRNT